MGEELLHERLGLAGLMRHELPPALLADLQKGIHGHLLHLRALYVRDREPKFGIVWFPAGGGKGEEGKSACSALTNHSTALPNHAGLIKMSSNGCEASSHALAISGSP